MSAAQAASLTHADIAKLLDAGMPESVTLASIAGNASGSDTSPDELIKPKRKGASATLLQVVLNPKAVQAGGGTGVAATQTTPQVSAAAVGAAQHPIQKRCKSW